MIARALDRGSWSHGTAYHHPFPGHEKHFRDLGWVALPKGIAFLEKVANLTSHISLTKGSTTQNSSDLSMGRCPDSKSDEFGVVLPLVIEIFSILCLRPLKKCYTFREHDPHTHGTVLLSRVGLAAYARGLMQCVHDG